MKIAFICTEKLPVPPVAGGAVQLYIEGIIPYLSGKHDITVFSIAYPGLPDEEENRNVKYIRVPAENAAKYVSNVKNRISSDFDLVHVFNRPLWVLSLSENLPDVKFSLSLHNEMFHAEKIPPVKAAECIYRVEFINTVSRFIADGVSRLYPAAESKLNVVYSGADTQRYHPVWSEKGIQNRQRLREKYNIQSAKAVLFVGRLSVKKGVHILINAMKNIMDSYPDTSLVVIGSKWYGGNKTDDYTKSLGALSANLTGPVVFTGFLPPSEIPAHYNLGDIFVCPSQWNEPLARVHYEAMAAGLPIITTNRGGNAEVVSGYGNGIVIDRYSSPDAFTESIAYLLNNPSAAAEMGLQGRRLAEDRYNWKRVAAEVLKPMDAPGPAGALRPADMPKPADIPGPAGMPESADDFWGEWQ